MQAVVLSAALNIAEHLPGGIEGQDRVLVAAGVGMVLLHQGPVRRLDFNSTCRRQDPKHHVGISGNRRSGQRAQTRPFIVVNAGALKQPTKNPSLSRGVDEVDGN